MSSTETVGANKLTAKFPLPGESDNCGLPSWSSKMYFMLTSTLNLSPYFLEEFNPNEFLPNVELGTMSKLSKFVTENRVLPFSFEDETAIVFV